MCENTKSTKAKAVKAKVEEKIAAFVDSQVSKLSYTPAILIPMPLELHLYACYLSYHFRNAGWKDCADCIQAASR